MHIVVLETDLFPDRQTVEEALAWLQEGSATHRLSRHDLRGGMPTEREWNELLEAILASDVVVTV